MACPDENVLLDFAEKRLDGAELRKVEHHLRTCASCREVVYGDAVATTTQLALDPVPSEPQPHPSDSLVGQQVGEYRVEELVGSGGMGLVYRGVHPLIGKTVAVKVLRPELAADPEQYRLMLREARAMSSIDSQRIVDIFAFGQLADGRHYMVMEYLRGESLSAYRKRSGPLPVKRVLELCLAILDALEPAHRAGIIHRDLKPSNLFLVEQPGQPPLVKLLDFGLAKRSSDREVTSMLRGTPAYMSPEQATAQRVDLRTDLYALGVIMFELATGERPFKAKSLLEFVKLHVGQRPPSPRSLRPELPAELDALVLALLEKDPSARPASCAEVRQRLLRTSPKKPAWLPVIAAAVVVSLVGVGVVLATRTGPSEPRVALVDPTPPPTPSSPVAPEPELEKKPEPEPVQPEPVKPEPAKPEPRAKPVVKKKLPAMLDRAGQLQQRASQLKLELVRRTPRGEEPDPVAVMLLDRAIRDAAAPDSDLAHVEKVLREVEQKYVRPR